MNKLLYLLLLIITIIYNHKFNIDKIEDEIEYLPKNVVNNINKYNKKKNIIK